MNELDFGIVDDVTDVLVTAGRQIIENDDRVAVGEQSVYEMGTDETGASSYQRPHCGPQTPREAHYGTPVV